MRSVRKSSVGKVAWWCVLASLALLVPIARTIEVHEDVNEGPIGAHLRLNSSSRAPPEQAEVVDERNVNDLPPPPPSATGDAGAEGGPQGANNYTTFPANHRQHSDATPSLPTTEASGGGFAVSPAPTSATVATGGAIAITASVLASPSATPPPPRGLSAFRAANGHVHPGRAAPPPAIVNDRAAHRHQHQLAGYRKRQLYASAVLPRNASQPYVHEQSSEGQFAKEFVPSPEVVPFFGDDSSSAPMMPSNPSVGQVPSSQGFVDAPYPRGLSDGDSKWYAGFGLPQGHTYTTTSKAPARPTTDHKFGWSTPFRQPESNVVHFPQDSAVHFPPPKGKWRWIPEDGDDDEGGGGGAQRKPSAGTPFSSGGGGGDSSAGSVEEQQQQPQPNFGKYYFTQPTVKHQPYSFDRTPGEGSAVFSSDAAAIGAPNGTTETSAEQPPATPSAGDTSTEAKLVGKEDAHLKSVSPWKKIIHVLSAAIPIGLLISALTPQVVYINPNATQPPIQLQTPTPVSGLGPATGGGGLRQRSLDHATLQMLLTRRGLGTDPTALVRLLHKLTALERETSDSPSPDGGLEAAAGNRLLPDAASLQLRLQGCDGALLCQLARQGTLPESDALHRTLWKIAHETPDEWTGRLGLEDVFRLIRRGDCSPLQRTCAQDARRDDEQ